MSPARNDQGAVAVMSAAIVALVVLIAAFAVDLGMQRVVRSDMQALADSVALDAARIIGDRDAADIRSGVGGPKLGDVVAASWERNRGSLGNPGEPDVKLVRVEQGSDGVMRPAVGSDGEVIDLDSGVPDAVYVEASGSVSFFFAGGTGSATRTALGATAVPSVCVSVGTRALALDTSESDLSPLLTHILDVNLDAVSYSGLVDLRNVFVPVADLAVALNAGTTEQLASATVSLSELLNAALEVVGQRSAAAATLQSLDLGVEGLRVGLAEILKVESGAGPAALNANVNLFDLLGAAIIAADPQRGLGVTVPGVLKLNVTEPPSVSCGRPPFTVESAQIKVEALSDLGGGLTLAAGFGSADVKHIDCAAHDVEIEARAGVVTVPAAADAGADGASPGGAEGLLRLELDPDDVYEELPLVLRGVLWAVLKLTSGGEKLEVGVNVRLSALTHDPEEMKLGFNPDPEAPPPTPTIFPGDDVDSVLGVEFGTPMLVLEAGGLLGAVLDLLTATQLATFVDVLEPLVKGTIGNLDQAILSPLVNGITGLIGVRFGEAEISLHSKPVCSGVRLIG